MFGVGYHGDRQVVAAFVGVLLRRLVTWSATCPPARPSKANPIASRVLVILEQRWWLGCAHQLSGAGGQLAYNCGHSAFAADARMPLSADNHRSRLDTHNTRPPFSHPFPLSPRRETDAFVLVAVSECLSTGQWRIQRGRGWGRPPPIGSYVCQKSGFFPCKRHIFHRAHLR